MSKSAGQALAKDSNNVLVQYMINGRLDASEANESGAVAADDIL